MALDQKAITQAIEDAASNYGVPPGLLLKMLTQESGLNPNIGKSSAGAEGIAQFMPATAKQYGINPSDTSDQSVLAQIGAAAHLLADNAKIVNNGPLPGSSKKDEGVWLKAAAAYNAGAQTVLEAEKKAFLNKDFDGNGDWEKYIPAETQQYVNIMKKDGGSGISATNWANNYAESKGIKPKSSTPSVPVPGSSALSPPNIADFQQDDGNGGKVTDTAGYYKAWSEYQAIQESKQKLASGPLAQYVDDTIKDIQSQIESGKLELSKANDQLVTKVNTFKNANDVYSSDVFRYGAAPGATSVPGARPGQTIPISGGVQLNPLQQALDINNQASSLIGNIQTPQVPSLASIMGGYQGQYGGQVPQQPSAGGYDTQASFQPSGNPLQAALQGVQPWGQQPSQPPPAPPPPEGASNSVANSSDIAALARILAQQAEGLGAPS